MFDGRCVTYPDLKILRDYLNWRQVDCHINNLYNTCFWSLVNQKKMSNKDAQNLLKDTRSEQKNEILFKDFGINYNNIEAIYRKGTILIRRETLKEKHLIKEKVERKAEETKVDNEIKSEKEEAKIEEILGENKEKGGKKENEKKKTKENKKEGPPSTTKVTVYLHEDLIGDDFWSKYKTELDYE